MYILGHCNLRYYSDVVLQMLYCLHRKALRSSTRVKYIGSRDPAQQTAGHNGKVMGQFHRGL